jgi:hypothetical protein
MKNIITAAIIAMAATAIIAMAATAVQADPAIDFAECVASRVAVENGSTLEAARAAFPAATRKAEIDLAMMANSYLELPANVKPQGLVLMLTNIPQSAACLRILENWYDR